MSARQLAAFAGWSRGGRVTFDVIVLRVVTKVRAACGIGVNRRDKLWFDDLIGLAKPPVRRLRRLQLSGSSRRR